MRFRRRQLRDSRTPAPARAPAGSTRERFPELAQEITRIGQGDLKHERQLGVACLLCEAQSFGGVASIGSHLAGKAVSGPVPEVEESSQARGPGIGSRGPSPPRRAGRPPRPRDPHASPAPGSGRRRSRRAPGSPATRGSSRAAPAPSPVSDRLVGVAPAHPVRRERCCQRAASRTSPASSQWWASSAACSSSFSGVRSPRCARATAACRRARRSRELRAVGHLLRQRVLEGVLRLRVERLLVDELRRLERTPGTPRGPPPAAPPRAARIGSEKLLPITAAVWSTCFSRSGSRSMRAASTACTVAGTSSSSTGVDQPVAPAAPLQAPGLDQRLHHLLDEEGIARRCARGSRRRARRRSGSSPSRSSSSSRIASGPERQQRQLLVVGLLHPLGVVLGAEVHQQERPRAGHRLDPLLEEGVAPRVDPVEVLDQRDGGLALRCRPGSAAARRRRAGAGAPRGPSAGRGRSGSGTPRKLEDQRQHLPEAPRRAAAAARRSSRARSRSSSCSVIPK